MTEFLKKMMKNEEFLPPQPCLDAFKCQFIQAVRTEWSSKDQCFEAIFYRQNMEHIARYDEGGVLQEYMIHLPPELLPYSMRSSLTDRGEIMSSVLLNKGYSISYEIILRNQNHERHLILLSETGAVLNEANL